MENVVQMPWWMKDARDVVRRLALKRRIPNSACSIGLLCAADTARRYGYRRSLESRKEVRLATLNAARAEMERVPHA